MGQFEKNGGMHNCESSSSKDHRNAGGEREIDGPDRSAPWEKCMLIKFRNFILHYERCGWGRGMQRATMVATKISSLKSLTAPRYTEAEGCGRTLTGINRLAEWQVGWKPPEWSERSKVVSRIEIVRSRIASCPTVRPWSHRWKKGPTPSWGWTSQSRLDMTARAGIILQEQHEPLYKWFRIRHKNIPI